MVLQNSKSIQKLTAIFALCPPFLPFASLPQPKNTHKQISRGSALLVVVVVVVVVLVVVLDTSSELS